MYFFQVTPFSIRKALKWIKENYQNPHIIITENGFSDSDGKLNDTDRISYLQVTSIHQPFPKLYKLLV